MANFPEAVKAAKKVKQIGENAKHQFIGVDKAIEALELAMVSGHHVLLLGQPGTGKTALANYFAESSQMTFGKIMLNVDIRRSDLFGPTDPIALQKGKWERMLVPGSLRNSQIFFADEVGRASGPVSNLFLQAMEERVYIGEGGIEKLPLHFVIGASNSLFSREERAFLDRWSIRVIMENWEDPKNLKLALENSFDLSPEIIPITEKDIATMANAILEMVKHLGEKEKAMLGVIFSEAKERMIIPVSNRNFLRMTKLAAANALLHERNYIIADDFQVFTFMWSVKEEIQIIKEILKKVIDDKREQIKELYNALEDLEKLDYRNMAFNDKAVALGKVTLLQKRGKKLDISDKNYYSRLFALDELIND